MYEILKELEEKELLNKALKSGIISITLAGHKMIYEIYLKHFREVGKKQEAVLITSTETNTSERGVYRIISEMEKNLS